MTMRTSFVVLVARSVALGLAFTGALTAALGACRRSPTEEVTPTIPSEPASDASAFAPLTEAVWLEELRAPADADAGQSARTVGFVSVPLGATEPRPILVAVHGALDRPEWSCGGFRGVTDAYPFIVCPRGTPAAGGRYVWLSAEDLDRTIQRALAATRARFGAYVADGPMMLAGFSQGAQLASYVAARRGAEFPRVVLVEGAWDESASALLARDFKTSGGARVLLACSTPGCATRFEPGRQALTRAGLDVRLFDMGAHGHNLNAEAVTALATTWPWITRPR